MSFVLFVCVCLFSCNLVLSLSFFPIHSLNIIFIPSSISLFDNVIYVSLFQRNIYQKNKINYLTLDVFSYTDFLLVFKKVLHVGLLYMG